MEQQQATPPKKRKHSEYHDPDYHQTEPPGHDEDDLQEQKRVKPEPQTDEERDPLPATEKFQRVREIVRAEFQREIRQKEEQLGEIDRRLLQARQLLDRLRYQVVSEYYRQQQVTLSASDVAKVRQPTESLFGEEGAAAQMPLHPAIKKIVGKRPISIPTNLPERTAATIAKESIRLRNPAHRRAERRRQQRIREEGIVTDHSKEEQQVQELPAVSVKLEDEAPCTSRQALERQLELNASRLNNKNKFNFVVGNTSKYIGDDMRGDSTDSQALVYKWLVYVQGRDLPQPLEAYIKKVRFQLHHSYRPNNIVDVRDPPFQISRRGWGEFPMRIQLFFQNHLHQKPVQLVHNVVLDKTMCGMHTMGAETIVEIWLRAEQALSAPLEPIPQEETEFPATLQAPFSPIESGKPRTISITQNKEELDDNLFAGINKIELSGDIDHIEPTVLVTEPLKLSYSPKKQPPPPTNSPRPQFRLNAAPVIASRPSVVYLPVNGRSPKHDSVLEKVKQEPSAVGLRHELLSSCFLERRWPESSSERPIKPVRNGHHNNKNVVFQKAGKLYIIDPLQRKLKKAVKQQSLLKPQLSLLKPPTISRWHMLQCIQHDHGYANMSMEPEVLRARTPPNEVTETARMRPRRLEQIFVSSQFRGMREAVEFLLRRLPLVGVPVHREEYPFTCNSIETFQKKPAIKQRCYEYLRARFLRRCMTHHPRLHQLNVSGRERYWSVREIAGFARVFGYTPVLKMPTSSEERDPKIGKQKSETEDQLAQLVQEQLKEGSQRQLSAFCSLSSGSRLETWIAKQSRRLLGFEHKVDAREFIDVLGMESHPAGTLKGMQRANRSLHVGSNRQLLSLPSPERLDSASQLVQDMCKDININLRSEESLSGVSQPLALTLLAHLLRTFVEKLVRRSVAAKLQLDSVDELPPAAANASLCLLPHDIGRVISQCSELDFLGNSHLGVASMEPRT
ncbi:uncharacterized protein D12 [Drosophila bipectinata]|uniref:uncharacterized protein D12 n=1 Tax=Drosophila bipectinata TaxID=42026 RepID=UPI0038B35260